MSSLAEASASRLSPLYPASYAVMVANRQRTCLFVFVRKLAFLPTCQHARFMSESVMSGNKFIMNNLACKSIRGSRTQLAFLNRQQIFSPMISSRLFEFVKNLSARMIRLGFGRWDFPAMKDVSTTHQRMRHQQKHTGIIATSHE